MSPISRIKVLKHSAGQQCLLIERPGSQDVCGAASAYGVALAFTRTMPSFRCERRPAALARRKIRPPMWNRGASASRPKLESIAARARLAGGCLETLIWPYFRQAHRRLSPGCSHVSSALGFDGQPLRKPACSENPQPVGHAAPRNLLNPWQTNTSFPRDLASAGATPRVILDAQPRRHSQMKGIPSLERLRSWKLM
jgi:hypothetical protein